MNTEQKCICLEDNKLTQALCPVHSKRHTEQNDLSFVDPDGFKKADETLKYGEVPTEQTCCEKCRSDIIFDTYPPLIPCKDRRCLCHTEQKCCNKCSGDFDGKGCTMSFGCPCHTEQKGWSEELQFDIMEDYIMDAENRIDDSVKPEILRKHFEKLVSFIDRTLQSQREEMVKKWEAERDNLVKDILRAICHKLKYRYIYPDAESKEPIDMLKLTDRLYEEFANPFNRPLIKDRV